MERRGETEKQVPKTGNAGGNSGRRNRATENPSDTRGNRGIRVGSGKHQAVDKLFGKAKKEDTYNEQIYIWGILERWDYCPRICQRKRCYSVTIYRESGETIICTKENDTISAWEDIGTALLGEESGRYRRNISTSWIEGIQSIWDCKKNTWGEL